MSIVPFQLTQTECFLNEFLKEYTAFPHVHVDFPKTIYKPINRLMYNCSRTVSTTPKRTSKQKLDLPLFRKQKQAPNETQNYQR